MKTACLLLLTTLFLSGCHFSQYDTDPIYRLNVPSYPHAYKAKIFYEEDFVEFDQPVVEVKSFTVDLNPIFDREKISDTLQAISQEFGYDILAVSSEKEVNWKESDNSFFEYMVAALAGENIDASYTTFSTKRLSVVGYKYLRNITYADQIIKSRTTYEIGDLQQELFINEQSLLPSGKQQSLKGDSAIFHRLNRFSERYFLQLENKDWQFRWTEKGTLIRTNKQYKYKISFDKTNAADLPVEVFMKEMEPPFAKYNISIFYNSTNQIVSNTILKGGLPYMSIEYVYDDKNRIEKENISFNQFGGRFEVRYDYYDQNGLWEILSPKNMKEDRIYSGE